MTRIDSEPTLETWLAVAELCQRQHATDCDIPMPVPSDVIGYPAVQAGQGTHQHGPECPPRCSAHFGDADLILTLRYSTRGWIAVYGVTFAEDGTLQASCWMD